MAGHTVIAAIVILLLGYASAQVCSRAALNSGTSNFPYNGFCELRWTCRNDLSSVLLPCPFGLLYDYDLQTCTDPNEVSCYNWNCEPGVPTTFPSVCDDCYFTCINGGDGFRLERCPPGQIYSNNSAQPCITVGPPNTYFNSEYCRRNTGTSPLTPVDPTVPCEARGNLGTYMKPASNGDHCSYDNYDPNNPAVSTITNRPCAAGTGFDLGTCRCLRDESCPNPQYHPKALDEQCRATMLLDFTDSFNAAEFKSSGLRMRTPDRVDRSGVRVTAGLSEFRTGSRGELPYLYMPRFNNNEMRSPMVFSITFRTDGTQQNFDLLRNERDDYCQGQASIWARASVNGNSLNVQVDADGLTDSGVPNSGQMMGTVAAGDWTKLTIIMENSEMRGILMRQNGERAELGPISIGDKLRRTSCGLEFGHGLNGEVQEVAIYEGCVDPTRVNPSP